MRIKIRSSSGRVVWPCPLTHSSVARPSGITGGEVQQAGVVGFADKVQDIHHSIHVRSQRVPQVRIEVGQPGAIYHQIEFPAQFFRYLGTNAQSHLRDISLNHMHALFQESRKPLAVSVIERIEHR